MNKPQKPRTVNSMSSHPDKEWGRAVELRALRWLRKLGAKPVDVAVHCYGWDIECGENKFEVKGRKSEATKIRLTENEWKAAQKHGKRYALLIFTASTKTKLDHTNPKEIPDPSRTAEWNRKPIFEYFLYEG